MATWTPKVAKIQIPRENPKGTVFIPEKDIFGSTK